MRKLTKLQAEVLQYIREFQRKNLYSPSIDDIAEEFQVYKNASAKHVARLEEKGFLQRSLKGRILFPRGTIVPFPIIDDE